MKKIGDIIGQASAAEVPAAGTAPEARPHRVSICYMVFAELHLVADGGRDARAKALEAIKYAKRTFRTAPFVHRIEVCERKDPATGEPIWVEVPGA